MARKIGLEIKKEIIMYLKRSECSIRELERKVNTNYNSIKTHLAELEYFGLVEIVEHEKNKVNGRPYKTAKLTQKGQEL